MTPQLNGFIQQLNHGGEVYWDFAAVMFVQVSLLAAVLLCLDLIVLRRVRASVRYAFWTLVLAKLVLPVSLHTPVSLSRWLPETQSISEKSSVGRADAIDDAISPISQKEIEVQFKGRPGTVPERAITNVIPSQAPLEPSTGTLSSLPPEPEIAPSRQALPVPESSPTRPHWKALVLLGWMAVVFALIALMVRRALLVRRIIARSEAPPDELQSLLAECLRLTDVTGKRVRIRLSNDLGSPAICGFRAATILLPGRLLAQCDPQQLRLIIVHELIHWRRYDLQVNCLQTMLQIAYFYNPSVWVANFILRRLREQAVDEAVLVLLRSPVREYSSTLLDVASLPRRPAELTLRLVGVVESRRALSGRIKRILSRPLPRSAQLGLTGMAAVLLAGLILLPMAGTNRGAAVAEPAPRKSAKANKERLQTGASPADSEAEQPASPDRQSEPASVLSGRIVDETGQPVTDAKVTFSARQGREQIETTTDQEGRYRVETVEQGGDYQLQIQSERWVGINYRDQEIVNLAPDTSITRDFTLPRACRLKIRAMDEQGQPIKGVRLMANSLAGEDFYAPETVSTDKEGWATLGGLAPSDDKYVVATMHDDYGFERLIVTLDDPTKVNAHVLTLRKGKDIRGTAICSDGKPPAGWRILALPSWWHFGRYPVGQTITKDGSFTLPHIVPGEYDVRISILKDGGGSTPKQVLKNGDLWNTEGNLMVKMDHPSPASLVYISGRVRLEGELADDGFWIYANSTDNETHMGTYLSDRDLKNGQRDFRIGPLLKGIYDLKAQRVGLESKSLQVTAPAENVELVVTAKGQPQLSGTVFNAETKQPLTDFRVRVTKLRTLSGPNYVEDANWRDFANDDGAFEIDVNGPGIYQVLVAAEGFAWTESEPINTVEDAGKSFDVALTRGVPLSGTVVNEQGHPVDGATVLALSKAAGTMPRVMRRFTTQDGAVVTEQGRFVMPHLLPGQETLQVTHPDYCFAVVPDVTVGPERGNEPLEITLTRGGTVRGHVYDAHGEPEPNITLYFQDANGYGGHMDEEAGRFATVVTDAVGFYEVAHLPEQLCYVHRAEEWSSLGVVRHCILPENGRTHYLDFGGEHQLSGRLLINGAPFADGRVLVAGENPNFGLFKAYAQTSQDGSFTFHGIPPGNRTLYYAIPSRRNDWGHLQEIRVTSENTELGAIDHRTGRIAVRFDRPTAGESANVRVTLQEYDPIWPHGNQVGFINRQTPQDPFVIEEVPPGTYELICYTSGQFQVRQLVEVTKDNLNQELTVPMPQGTASLSGRVDGQICGPGGCSSLKVWSKDSHLLGYVIPQQDGTYHLDNIPAGEYIIRDKDTRNAAALLEVSLENEEKRTLDFTPDNVSPTDVRIGFLEVRVYTQGGIPLPCEVHLESPSGRRTPSSSQYGRVVFTEPPDTYTLVISHPGFEPVTRAVELKPVDKDGRPAEGYSLRVHLEKEP